MSRFGGELLDDNETKTTSRFGGELVESDISAAPTQAYQPKGPTLLERGKEVLKQTGVGAAAGAVMPEILSYGVGPALAAFPVTAPAAPYVMGMGRALRGQRLASTGMGAIGGGVGETAGQTAEALGANKMEAEAARFVGGMIAPEPARFVGTRTGKALTALAGAFGVPGASKARTIGDVLNLGGIDEARLTPDQRAFIQQKLENIRRGPADLAPQRDLGNYLRQVAERQRMDADAQARQLESEAASLIQSAETQGQVISAQAQKRISDLQGQLNTAADNIRSKAQIRANVLMAQAQDQANTVIQGAAQQSPQVRQIAQVEADKFLADGRQAAERVIAEAEQRSNRLRTLSTDLRSSGRQRVAAAQPNIGTTNRISEIGTDIRNKFTNVLDNLKAQRKANADANSQKAFGEAFQKESAGQTISNTQAVANAIQEIKTTIRNPVTGLRGVSDESARELNKVQSILSGTKVDELGNVVKSPRSFEAVEQLRRSLRDRASGLPAEGYDAIGQQLAGRLADLVEAAQKEFSPNFGKFLEQYKKDSEPINKFANTLGKAITGKSEINWNEFARDPVGLADAVFRSDQGVKQLVETVGQQEAERVARTYVASKLQGANGKQISDFLESEVTKDWLYNFPNIQAEVSNAAKRLQQAERVSGRREKLAGVLRTEMGMLPTKAATKAGGITSQAEKAAARAEASGERAAGKITSQAERDAAQAISAGERQAAAATAEAERDIAASARAVERQTGRIETEAEKRAKEALSTAETAAAGLTKQAKDIRAKAQDTANLITQGSVDGTARIRNLVQSENTAELDAIADILLQSSDGREKFGQAVGQIVAERAGQSVKTAANDWRYISERLVNRGLIDQDEADRIAKELNDVLVTPADVRTKLTMTQSLIRNAIAGYAVPGVERIAETLVTGE